MKKLVLFYSYTGSCKRIAGEYAKKEGADLCEIKEVKRPGTLKAYTAGCVAAMRGKSAAIQPVGENLSEYEKIVVIAPVWAGKPAPAAISALHLLPKGKTVEVVMVSASGNSSAKDMVAALVRKKGCTLLQYRDQKNR